MPQEVLEETSSALLEDRRWSLRQRTASLRLSVAHVRFGSHEGILSDISRTGARFVSETFFPCGDNVRLLPPENSGLPAVQVRIMRQRLVESGDGEYFEYGVRFNESADLRRHAWFLELRRPE